MVSLIPRQGWQLGEVWISKLKRLLVESEKSVKELSSKVGFGTTANMFPMFKRHTGMMPKEYREKHSSSPGS